MNASTPLITLLAQAIPPELYSSSGKVFYSGRLAFSKPSPLYVLGVNPGGAPEDYTTETVRAHTEGVLRTLPEDWSAYRDESWDGALPGTNGMAPRLLHMFKKLKLNPGEVPASNLVFVRSPREADIKTQIKLLADRCWGFHKLAITELKPRVIVCLGQTAGNYVRSHLGANTNFAEFTERNRRRWRSQAYSNPLHQRVVVATHPSIADWTAKETDPTDLIRMALT